MASEAITRNDLKAILNEVLPPTPSEYRKLLWENPSPTAAFAAQTISLDLSDYDEVEIEYIDFVQHQDIMAQIKVTIGSHGSMHIMIGNSGYSSGVPFVANRRFLVNLTGIDFEGASGIPTNNSLTSRNDTCIPLRIYGIKYERVAPPQIELPTYSTTEQVIGTWIDGKPIYRKVLTGTSAAGTTNVNVLALSIDFMVNAHITIHNSGNSSWVFDSYVQTSGSDSFNLYMSADRSVIYLRSGSSYAFGQYWLTLEYTKTTD